MGDVQARKLLVGGGLRFGFGRSFDKKKKKKKEKKTC